MTQAGLGARATHAERLLTHVMSYKLVEAVDALVRAKVISVLKETGARSSIELAQQLELVADHLEPLLGIAVRMGLLERDGGTFRISTGATPLLALIELELWTRSWHARNDSLFKVLKGAQPQDPMAGDVSTVRPLYDASLAEFARMLALHLVRDSALRGHHVVDLGGADGALASHLLRLGAARSAVVVDRESARQGFETRRAGADAAALMHFVAADLKTLEEVPKLFSEAGLVILSNVAHLLRPEERNTLWRAIAAGVPTGCHLLIYDQFPALHVEGEREAAPTSSDLMMVDWLRCGVRFDLTAQRMADEIQCHGFVLRQITQAAGLPGRLVCLVRAPR